MYVEVESESISHDESVVGFISGPTGVVGLTFTRGRVCPLDPVKHWKLFLIYSLTILYFLLMFSRYFLRSVLGTGMDVSWYGSPYVKNG